jgi:hypothetical protein
MTDKPIHFTAIVAQVRTMADGGLRLTFDLPETAINIAAAMMQAKQAGALVECAALFVKQELQQVKEDNVRPKTRYSPYAKNEETKGKKDKGKKQ